MQLYQKKNFFLIFLLALSKFIFNFEHFQKNDYPHSWYIFELTESEKRGWINV